LKRGTRIDEIGFKIINELSNNPRMTINELSKKTKISRPTVTARLKALTDAGLFDCEAGLSLKNLGFVTAIVSLEAKREQDRISAEEHLAECPRVHSIFRSPSKANIQCLVWAENDHTLTSCIGSLRNLEGVNIVSVDYLGTPTKGDIIIKAPHPQPGRVMCKTHHYEHPVEQCQEYVNGLCMGCPATRNYRYTLMMGGEAPAPAQRD